MNPRAARPGGYSTKTGRKTVRSSDGLPTVKEVRELAQQLDASNRRARCGRPGRKATPEYLRRLLEKLTAASKGGRGIRFLSRDELDAVLTMCRQARRKAGGARGSTKERSAGAGSEKKRAKEAGAGDENGDVGDADDEAMAEGAGVDDEGVNGSGTPAGEEDAGSREEAAGTGDEGADVEGNENANEEITPS